MKIEVRRKGKTINYSKLQQGDTFILPKGETVYMKLQELQHFSNIPGNRPAVNLGNGNIYSCFRGKQVIKVDSHLKAMESEQGIPPEGWWHLITEGNPAEINNYLLTHPELADRYIQLREKED